MTTDKSKDQEKSFAELLEASLKKAPPVRIKEGQEVTGTVLQVGSDWTFVDIGAKGEASIATSELLDDKGKATVQVGEILEARVLRRGQEGIVLSRVLGGGSQGKRILEDAHQLGMPVEGVVKTVIKGGLEVEVGGVRAFCPASQISLRYVEDLTEFVDRKLSFRVTEYREEGRSVVVSRKVLLAEERAKQAEKIREKLVVGAVLPGKVNSIREFGAFVDLGGIDGLLHISEISHSRVSQVEEVLHPGQDLTVQIIKMEGERLSLSLKSLAGDPWETIDEQFALSSRHQGTVVRVQPFGAFVELAPGVDGLLHVSTLDDPRIQDARRAFEEGQSVDVTVVSVDSTRKRIGLAPSDRIQAGTGSGTGAVSLDPGNVVTGTVERVEHYGIFLRLPGATEAGRSPRGLVPREEIRDAPDDLRSRFPIGQEVRAEVLEPDEKGRMRLSERAAQAADERALATEYLDTDRKKQGGSSGPQGGFGTLGDLFKKVEK
jgi:small subunit ribosomal protein S1